MNTKKNGKYSTSSQNAGSISPLNYILNFCSKSTLTRVSFVTNLNLKHSSCISSWELFPDAPSVWMSTSCKMNTALLRDEMIGLFMILFCLSIRCNKSMPHDGLCHFIDSFHPITVQVTSHSQKRHRPFCRGIAVTPSCRFPSFHHSWEDRAAQAR
jgi:hypothetical protein